MHDHNAPSNPAFATPDDVVKAEHLGRERKLGILRQWEYDAREKEVAEEENMAGGEDDRLALILKAIDDLEKGGIDTFDSPHKQGGQ